MLWNGYTSVPAEQREAHTRRNVSMWAREKDKAGIAPTHTLTGEPLSGRQPERTPISKEAPRPCALPKTSSLSSPESGGFLATSSYTVVSEQSI